MSGWRYRLGGGRVPPGCRISRDSFARMIPTPSKISILIFSLVVLSISNSTAFGFFCSVYANQVYSRSHNDECIVQLTRVILSGDKKNGIKYALSKFN